MSTELDRERLQHKTFLMMLRVLVIFAIPAGIAFFIGRWVDVRFDMRPIGSLAVLGVAFVISWTLVIRLYLSMSKEYREIEAREARESEQKKQ